MAGGQRLDRERGGDKNFRCDVLVAYVPSVQLTHIPVRMSVADAVTL